MSKIDRGKALKAMEFQELRAVLEAMSKDARAAAEAFLAEGELAAVKALAIEAPQEEIEGGAVDV